MKHGSLFSGIGGFDLAAEWMGWENVFHCEWMEFPKKILKYYWPNAISYHDITKTDFTIHRGTIDILTGGFPCQPYSMAGKRKGKNDERHLWPHMHRAIQEIEPTYIVGENVYGIVNWNGGLVFEEVCVDLENCGYQVQPVLLPCSAINAPHKRERIFFIAYNNGFRCNQRKCNDEINPSKGGINALNDINQDVNQWNVTNPNVNSKESPGTGGKIIGNGNEKSLFQEQRGKTAKQHIGLHTISQNATNPGGRGIPRYGGKNKGEQLQTAKSNTNHCQQFGRMGWEKFPIESPVCGGNDGVSYELDGITFPKWRNESIRGYGNAVVPPLIYEIFKVIQQMEDLNNGGKI